MFQSSKYRELMRSYAKDPFNLEDNFALGLLYEDDGHNAGAASHYLRTAEFGVDKNPLLAYEALLRLAGVMDRQTHRFLSARWALLQAVALQPRRPEGYFLLSRFYERAGEYGDCYFVACMGLANADFSCAPLRSATGYPGKYGLIFERAVSSWWVGYREESISLFRELNQMRDLDPLHRAAVSNNLHNFGLGHEVPKTTQVPEGALCFDIGANRGDATRVALDSGYSRVLAIEPGPAILELLRANFSGDPRVEILDLAVSNTDDQTVTFYEAEEDGLSTLNIEWLTGETARYKDRPYREVTARTITMNTLISQHGLPDLVKIDVEGAEDWVLRGMTCNPGPKHVALEWHVEELPKVFEMLCRLRDVNGYREYALQYITHHLHAPIEYRTLDGLTYESLVAWHDEMRGPWESGGWIEAGRLRPTADAGMFWVR